MANIAKIAEDMWKIWPSEHFWQVAWNGAKSINICLKMWLFLPNQFQDVKLFWRDHKKRQIEVKKVCLDCKKRELQRRPWFVY